MPQSYFRQIPNFEYVNRNKGTTDISDYISVKNLFKRGKLRSDIFGNVNYFTKYKIIGDERPDNIANQEYGDSKLDWVILLSNNIINLQTEWPLPQSSLDEVLLEKYGTYDKLYNQKVVVGLVDDVNLVFSVSLNKEIEEIFYTIL